MIMLMYPKRKFFTTWVRRIKKHLNQNKRKKKKKLQNRISTDKEGKRRMGQKVLCVLKMERKKVF